MPTRQQVLEGLRAVSEEILESLHEDSPGDDLQYDKSHPAERECERTGDCPHQPTDRRSTLSEGEDTSVGHDHLQPDHESEQSIHGAPTNEPKSCWDGFVGVSKDGGRRSQHRRLLCRQREPNISQPGQGLASSPPALPMNTISPAKTTGKMKVPKNMAVPPHGNPSAGGGTSAMGSNDQTQVALRQAALDQWGNKVISWGRKHNGKTFRQVFEMDPGYIRWVQARAGNLHEDLEDFMNYANTRQRLQSMAQNVINQ